MKRAAIAIAVVTFASTAGADDDPRLAAENPFACLGAYEAITGRNSIATIRRELDRRLARQDEEGLSPFQRAVDACIAGRLAARVGDGDAPKLLERAIELAPEEPGFELFAGLYWSGMRGARGPVLARAEDHYYTGLAKLEALRTAGRARVFHDTVEDWIRKQLLVLYQQDGAPLLPWKAYPQRGTSPHAPGLSVSSQPIVARDTRDFFYNSEMRQFTGEATFAASDLRANRALTQRELWDIARAPLRFLVQNRLRLRQNLLGAFDAIHAHERAENSQIRDYYHPGQNLSDVTVFQVGAGWERGFALSPLFDLRLAGSYRRVVRQGVVEFRPDIVERFDVFEARPSVSRFLGSDKLTLDGVYVWMDLASQKSGIADQRLRQKVIRAFRIDYALYSPVMLPGADTGWLGWQRTPIRGWHLYGGAAEDEEVYGLRTIVNRDVYAGTRFEGSQRLDFTLQGTYYTQNTTEVSPNTPVPVEYSTRGLYFSSVRGTAIAQLRLVNPDAAPGVGRGPLGFVADMVNLVFPVHYDHAVRGLDAFENVRAGAELWARVFATGLGGTAFLFTAGYDFQYFHNLDKAVHLGRVALRMGWGDL